MKKSTINWIIKSIFVAIFAAFCIFCFVYPPKARIIPLIISISGLIATTIDLFMPQKVVLKSGDVAPKEKPVDKTLQHSEIATWSWIAFFFGLIILSGLIYGSTLFLLFFLKWFWKEKWTVAIWVSSITGICIYLLFYVAFRMELYSGVLLDI